MSGFYENMNFCGEGGIRTPGSVTFNSFRDCHNRPLCHLSRWAGLTGDRAGAAKLKLLGEILGQIMRN